MWRASAAALCAAVVLAGCNPFDPERVLSQRELAADPAHAVRPPDAVELFRVGDDLRQTIDGPAYPFDGFGMGTQLSQSELFAFYDQQLRSMGWLQDDDAIRSSGEVTARSWCKPKITFRLGIFQPAEAKRFLSAGQSFTQVFVLKLQARARPVCPFLLSAPTPSR